ncbi:hypothetical protein O9929_04640 [Vibrio lentus]|nr:hypothetical protein [Vibrio lentus]
MKPRLCLSVIWLQHQNVMPGELERSGSAPLIGLWSLCGSALNEYYRCLL